MRKPSAAVTITLSVVLLALITHFCRRDSPTPVAEPARDFAAELASAEGIVLLQNPGRSEWREVAVGAKLNDGDLIQTDKSASIRYRDGFTAYIQPGTIFTVREESQTEVRVSPQKNSFPSVLLAGEDGEKLKKRDHRSHPSIELQRIIPFGRSLELIGKVEAGSSLLINDEIVGIAGDGSFKHFTKPFPNSERIATLVLKVTDLAGRTRTVETTHDFNPHSGGKRQ